MDYFDFAQWPFDTSATELSENTVAPNSTTSSIPTPVSHSIWASVMTLTPSEIGTLTGCSEDQAIVSISTTFHADANINGEPPNLIVISSDKVFFYVHRHKLLDASNNAFGNLLLAEGSDLAARGPSLVVPVEDTSPVINVVLHTIYDLTSEPFHPSLVVLSSAIDSMNNYGLSICNYASPNQPLYQLLLSQAPYDPINFYALAAAHNLEDLAVAISPHLLSYNLSLLTDELVARMGAIYLRRLFFLHRGRLEALKRLLLRPPEQHGPISSCDEEQQRKLTRAWALAAAQLAWDARPGK